MDARRTNSKASLVDRELLFLVAKFLESSPCHEAAQVLKKELYHHELLPTRRNWLGEERQLTYNEVQAGSYAHVQSTHLQQLCTKLLSSLHTGSNQPHSLLGTAVLSSLQYHSLPRSGLQLDSAVHASHYLHELSTGFREQPVVNICQMLTARQMSSKFTMKSFQGPQLYKSIRKQGSFLGHLAPVFCVLFDRTGRCIITGADDDLLKVWSSETGQLLATLRGHSAEVTDVSLSYDNTMIASGSLDRSVRVWCAQSSASLAVLTGHQSHVTSVQFSPSPIEESRYLASTGKDGYLFFWQWLPESETFSASPVKFMEKNRMGDHTLCSAFSPGGKYFVTGGTDHIVRVYICIPGPPTLQAELEDQHTEKIMTVQFGNTGEGLFSTGSDDGTVCIWRFREVGWTHIILQIPKEELFQAAVDAGKMEKTQVTMVGWEMTDSFLVSATTPDCHVRVWRSTTGEHIQTLKGHIGEVFVLECHPSESRLLLSAGHDGVVIFWDMLAGVKLQSFQLVWEDDPVCVFDSKFSPDGLQCAVVDSHGFLTIMGFGSNESYKKQPMEQFFHTDYRPLMRDRNQYVVDEQTQLPPHLLPPPYLVDIDGHAHPACYQEALLRLVRPAEQVRQERTAEEMDDYDEYMKKHLLKVKQQSFGFGRARTNFSNTSSSATASSSTLSQENADCTSLNSSAGAAESISEQSGAIVSASTSTTATTSTSAAASNNGGCGSHDGDEAMDTAPSGPTTVTDGGDCPGEETMATDSASSLEVENETVTCSSLGATDNKNSSYDEELLTPKVECKTDLINSNDSNKARSMHSPSHEVKSESIQAVVLTEYNYSMPPGDGSETQPPSATLPSTSTVASNSSQSGVEGSRIGEGQNESMEESVHSHSGNGVGMESSDISNSYFESNASQWNGIRTRHQVRLASVNDVNAEDVPDKQDHQPPEQQPLGFLPQLGERIEEEAPINIVDVDESSQDSQNMLSSLVYSLGLTEHETKQAISLWHNRTIIPPLDPAEIIAESAKRMQLYREEQDNFEEQSRKAELLAVPSPTPRPGSMTKGRSLRSGRTIPDPMEPQRVDSIDSEPVMISESSESEADEWKSDSDSDESSDVSDWTAEAGIKFINKSQRKRRRRKSSNHEDELSSEDEYGEEEGEDGDLGPSKRAEQRKERSSEGLLGPAVVKRETKPKKKRLTKSLEAYRPPDWILQTKPTLSPYLPQVGDIVVYCYQGHQLYVEDVRQEKVYPIKNVKMPWQKYKLQPQEFCQITNVRYVIGPPTLCQITLALLSHPPVVSENPSTSQTKQQRISFQIKYHDMDGVLDFLILDSVYKASLVHHWTPGQKFRSLIDGTYWYGIILEKKPFDKELPSSCWQSYFVEWGDNKDTDRLSPWDMEPLPDDSESVSIPADGEDSEIDSQASRLLAAASGSEIEAWGREGERERILRGLATISGLAEAYQFREPVSLELVQDYCTVVAFPTDLSTITKRLENGFYRRKLALLWEVAMLSRNAKTYNEEDSLIVEHARILTETLWKFINAPEVEDPLQCYNSTPSGEVVETEVEVRETDMTFVPPEDVQLAETGADEAIMLLHPIPPESPTPTPWLSSAQELLNTLERNANSSPFLEPVDTDMYSDYLSYVNCPMDLGTVRQKLQSGEYSAPREFVVDIELVFANAKSYNAKNSEIYKMTLDLQRVFESHCLSFLKSCPGLETTHIYGTRRAIGKLSTHSKTTEMRNSSVSSSESMASSSYSQNRPPPQRRYPKRVPAKSTRAQTRSTSHDYPTWSDGEERHSLADEEDRGRSISVDASISSEELLAPSSASRRQTRSMAKKGTVRRGVVVGKTAHEPYSKENGFGMTLRKRGTKRPLEHDGESDEESGSEIDVNEQEDSDSDNASLEVEPEEEEEYDEEEEEETESVASSVRKKSRLRSQVTSKSQRKRQRMSSDSDEDLPYTPSTFLTRSSRSGRLVKANTKYS